MEHRWLGFFGAALPALLFGQFGTGPEPQAGQTSDAPVRKGPYARIATLRVLDGRTVDFESGYIRHLEWHRQAGDSFTWYGWSITHGERQRWFVYATFGHSAADFDNAVSPADDERDNVLNVVPHAEFTGSAVYEFLPRLSQGTGEPQRTPRLELTAVDLVPGAEKAFEAAMGAGQAALKGETLWYRMLAGGTTPRYVRLRPRPSYSALFAESGEQALPESVRGLIGKTTVEILTLRPTMSYNLAPVR
jgi:hypothetical protein